MPDPAPDLFQPGPMLRPVPERLRVPSWADPAARPESGPRCAVCWGGLWWTEATEPRRGWRCWCCIPAPVGMAGTEVET